METSSLKFWRSFAILLIVLNIGLLLFTFFKSSRMGGPREGGHGGPAKFIIEKLHFDKSQEVQFDSLKTYHHASILKLNEKERELREQYFSGLKASPIIHSDSILALISNNQEQKDKITFEHFASVKKLCNPEQAIIFDDIIGEVLERMRPSLPPPHERH